MTRVILIAVLTLWPHWLLAEDEALVVPQVVIAADQSGSMHDSGNIGIQTRALIAALERHVQRCGSVEVTYLPWGGEVAEPVTFFLGDTASKERFTTELVKTISPRDLKGTNHGGAATAAIQLIRDKRMVEAVLVFITDDSGAEVVEELPDGITLFKISIGTVGVKTYVRDSFMPKVGYHFHADSSEELAHIIADVFLMMDRNCIG